MKRPEKLKQFFAKVECPQDTHFPIDMLRYDGAMPYDEASSRRIEESIRNGRACTILLRKWGDPQRSYVSQFTEGRWQSFGVRVEVLLDEECVYVEQAAMS